MRCGGGSDEPRCPTLRRAARSPRIQLPTEPVRAAGRQFRSDRLVADRFLRQRARLLAPAGPSAAEIRVPPGTHLADQPPLREATTIDARCSARIRNAILEVSLHPDRPGDPVGQGLLKVIDPCGQWRHRGCRSVSGLRKSRIHSRGSGVADSCRGPGSNRPVTSEEAPVRVPRPRALPRLRC